MTATLAVTRVWFPALTAAMQPRRQSGIQILAADANQGNRYNQSACRAYITLSTQGVIASVPSRPAANVVVRVYEAQYGCLVFAIRCQGFLFPLSSSSDVGGCPVSGMRQRNICFGAEGAGVGLASAACIAASRAARLRIKPLQPFASAWPGRAVPRLQRSNFCASLARSAKSHPSALPDKARAGPDVLQAFLPPGCPTSGTWLLVIDADID